MVKRAKVLFPASALAVSAAVGCASILSIPDRSQEWCDRPENAHDFCDDFDHADAGGAPWIHAAGPGSSIGFVSSSDTPPNAIDLSVAPLPLGGRTVAGIFQQFTDKKFQHVRVGVDVLFASASLGTEGGLDSQLGFLLLAEQDFCIGIVLTPAGLGMVMRAHSTDCTSVSNLPADAGRITDDAGLTSYATVAPAPGTGQWLHLVLDVNRNANGGGTVTFNPDNPGAVAPPQIPPGYLTESAPQVAVATSVAGPTGRLELQFDNVTVDFLPN